MAKFCCPWCPSAEHIWLGGNPGIIIYWLHNSARCNIKHSPIVCDNLSWKASCMFCHFSHSYREANQVADCVANRVLKRDVMRAPGDIVDPLFATILQAGACSIPYIRKALDTSGLRGSMALLENRLNNRVLLSKKLGQNVGNPAICSQSSESVNYLLSSCAFFSNIWKCFCSTLGVLHPQSSFRFLCLNWLKRNFTKRSQPIILMLLVASTWSCWKEQNSRLFLK